MTTDVMTHTRPEGHPAAATAAPHTRMDRGLPTGANHIVHSHVLSRCVQHLEETFGSDLDGDLIRHTVQRVYRELEATARLKTFLPVLAAREAADRLRELAVASRTQRADAPGTAAPGTAMTDTPQGTPAPATAASAPAAPTPVAA